MSKGFREYRPEQAWLLPPWLEDWLPEGLLARFLSEVTGELDLRPIYQSYEEKDGRGQAAYEPLMMLRVLLYGYCLGVVSSRRIEKATSENVAFRYLSADQPPDHDTLAEFRRRHWPAMAALFVQVLRLCQQAGLVKRGHVALDGSKIKAHASRYRNRS
jgi:transposase